MRERSENGFIRSFKALMGWCEAQHFKGWDPYDGLNSKVFKALPLLGRSALCRLAVIQGFKRCPVNLRRLALVPKEYNAKGIGLFLKSYCNLYKLARRQEESGQMPLFGTSEQMKEKVEELSALLIELKSKGEYSGACWGYNFDWQARRLFLFPKGTPTVVATSFCADALFDAYEITEDRHLLDEAVSSAAFVMNDLHRHACKDGGFLFSYSPLNGNDTVINASLLGSRLLARAYACTGIAAYRDAARESVAACCALQNADGSWRYGLLPVQKWVDSFHTGYNLEAIYRYEQYTGDTEFYGYFENGMEYYLEHFFEADGCPKYYDIRKYPIDIHCPAQLIVTLARTGLLDRHRDLAERVLGWTVSNMQKSKGWFIYQKKRTVSSQIPYMRWSNAFMFCAFSEFFVNLQDYEARKSHSR